MNKRMWQTWKQLQENGVVSYQNDPEHNLNIGGRKDSQRFAEFCHCQGLVLDVGCGPQSWPAYYRQGVTYIGLDPLMGDGCWFSRVRGLAEFLPFRGNVFDHVLFATCLDHFVDPVAALKAGVQVCKDTGEIDVWLGEKSFYAPRPATSPEWYRSLQRPDLAEDLFHVKRLSREEFMAVATDAGLILVQAEVDIVDDYRTNVFYRLRAV